MDDRLGRLEAQVEELAEAVRSVDRRLSALESRGDTRPVGNADQSGRRAVSQEAEAGPDVMRLLSHAGRSCLVLGGAYLVRAITEAGAIGSTAGAALGLAYAVAWLVLADRAGRLGDRVGAAFTGVTAVAIAFPLVWETTLRFKILGVTSAAGIVAVLTVLGLTVAWRTRMELLAWAAAVAAIVTSAAMLVVTHQVVIFCVVLLALGLATVWLGYSRGWHGLQWPAALVADVTIFAATAIAARPGGPKSPYEHMSIPAVVALAAALIAVYVGSFAVRILSRRRNVTAFEAVQALAALGIGLGGAWRVVTAAGWNPLLLGVAALTLGAAFYAVAFTFVERRDGRGLSFQFFTSSGLVLAVAGSAMALGHAWLVSAWCLLALAAAAGAARFDRITLRAHSALYLGAAALTSGLVAWTLATFLGAGSAEWRPLGTPAVVALLAAAAAYPLLASGQRSFPVRWFARLPALGAGVVAALGLAGLGVLTAAAMLRRAPGPLDPGVLAAIRSALLAVAVLLLAWLGRHERFAELRWLAFPLLVAAGVKLLVEDFAVGRALTLFPALACYGIVLIFAPRLLRRNAGSSD